MLYWLQEFPVEKCVSGSYACKTYLRMGLRNLSQEIEICKFVCFYLSRIFVGTHGLFAA